MGSNIAFADVVIVGAGQAGAHLAVSLRQSGFAGSVALLGDERDPPYERPPLSKDYLAGTKEFERLLLRPREFWAERQVTLSLNTKVVAIDAAAHQVSTDSGQRIGYRYLVWAAGGAPRTLSLPGSDLAGIHVIRTRHQVDGLRAELARSRDVVVIGGGYVGLEAAAVLIKLGKNVTVLEAQDRLLARVAGSPISRFYEAEHRRHGVDVRTGVRLAAMAGTNGRISAVVLADGTQVPTQVAIVGIGLVPHQEVLAQAGALCSNGVDVDAYCRTSLPDVFAIGDCANHPNLFAGGAKVRLESVPNACEQANTVAGVILGKAEPYRALPWFWSNQYDLKLQTAGLSVGYDATVQRGDPATRSFSLVYLRDGRIIAIDAINNMRDFIQAKPLIEAGARPDLAQLADAGVPLKTLSLK